MPNEIYQIVKNQIIANKVIRKDAEWFYDFTQNEAGDIELKQTVKCKILNLCHEPVENPVKLIIRPTDNNPGLLEKAVCLLRGEDIIQYDVDDPEKNLGIKISQTSQQIEHVVNITIPPNEEVELTTVFKHFYSTHVHDEYFTSKPLVNASLYVTFPEGYKFEIFPSMSSEFKITLKEKNRHMYRLEGEILPYQGFVYLLSKTEG